MYQPRCGERSAGQSITLALTAARKIKGITLLHFNGCRSAMSTKAAFHAAGENYSTAARAPIIPVLLLQHDLQPSEAKVANEAERVNAAPPKF